MTLRSEIPYGAEIKWYRYDERVGYTSVPHYTISIDDDCRFENLKFTSKKDKAHQIRINSGRVSFNRCIFAISRDDIYTAVHN